MSIKEKIIHWLGGFTEQEYRKIEEIAKKPAPVFRTERPVRTLKAAYKVDMMEEIPPEKWIKQKLEDGILDQMREQGLIKYLVTEEDGNPIRHIRAIVQIVDPEGQEG